MTASVSNNTFIRLGHQWLRLKEYGNVTIVNNSFGDYNKIVIGPTKNHVQCLFAHNSITKTAPNSFDNMNSLCILQQILFKEVCACGFSWLGDTKMDIRSESYCTVGDTLKHCFNSTLFNVAKYEAEICNPAVSTLNCAKNKAKNPIDAHFVNLDEEKGFNKIWIWASIISFLILCMTVVLVIICCKIWRRKSSSPTSMTELSSTQQNVAYGNQHVFSDGDRAIIAQTLKQMKEKYPREVYDQVYNNTKKLTDGNLGELEIVRTIGEIVKTLDECQNPGDDFVAFTDILYKHLAPKNNNQQDPIYAIPDLTTAETSSNETETGMTNLDHIYAEPHSVQQPLLTNEYSSPLDRDELGNLYSEPINVHGESKLITPYAVAGNALPSTSQPTKSKNLPDVLCQSTNAGKVQRLAENLANDPTFHHQLPQYTIPNKRSKFVVQPSTSAAAGMAGPSTSVNADRRQFGSESSNSNSEHSGGSNVTLEMDDVIDYVDA